MKARSFRLPLRKGRLLWLPEDIGEAILPGDLMFNGHLTAARVRDGRVVEEWDLGSGVVTTAGVNYLASDFNDGANDISAFDYHHCGIGTTAAVVGDTTLENVTGMPARVAGTPSNPSANQYRSIGTISFPTEGPAAITEWGLFSASTAGTLWDRRVFAAINVVDGDSIEFTYTLTCNAGG